MQRRKRKDFEIKFYEKLIEDNPRFIQALFCLGDAYTKKGFYREGLDVDRKLVKLRPNDPVVHYNFACSLSLTGKVKQAFKELERAVFLGYNDFSYILEDRDLENVRNDPAFKDFFNKLKIERFKDYEKRSG